MRFSFILGRAKRYKGLTLMEIVVSLGMLATISLSALGVLSKITLQGGKSAHQTAATFLAEELVARATLEGPPYWGFDSSSRAEWEGERPLILPGDDKETLFKYRLESLKLRDTSDDLGTVHQLKMSIWWWGDEAGSRIDNGRTAVERVRTVYVRR